jgi:hypothetical protein
VAAQVLLCQQVNPDNPMVALGVQVNGHPHHEIAHDEVASSAGKVVPLLDVTFQIADKAHVPRRATLPRPLATDNCGGFGSCRQSYLFVQKGWSDPQALAWSTRRMSRLGKFISATTTAPICPAPHRATERYGPVSRPNDCYKARLHGRPPSSRSLEHSI